MALYLNARALDLVKELESRTNELKIAIRDIDGGGRFVDCGLDVRGGLAAGLALARVCLAGLAEIALVPGSIGGNGLPHVAVSTDHPILACLASQYAGWALKDGKFFAMGSGPMRAAAGTEPIFETIGHREQASRVVGVLETRKPPTPEIVAKIAAACGAEPANVTLLAAPTASLAGGLQIAARSVETAIHKLAELKFDLGRIVAGYGVAPLPPVAHDDLAAIGRTNDAILYGAQVTLYVTGDEDSLAAIAPRVPSAASADFGEPFASIFARYHHDFYKIDPLLFSPAQVALQNLDSGRTHLHGQVEPEILARSFGLP